MSLVLNDLAVVLDELHDVRKLWYEIGLRLNVSVEDLETISSEHKSDQHSLRRVVLLWLKSGNATWCDLCKALRNRTIGKSALGDSLRERYCQGRIVDRTLGLSTWKAIVIVCYVTHAYAWQKSTTNYHPDVHPQSMKSPIHKSQNNLSCTCCYAVPQ